MIYSLIKKLIGYAIKNEIITEDDCIVVQNALMDALHLENLESCDAKYENETCDEILSSIVSYACETGIISDTASSRDLFDTKIMGILTPMPREVIAKFKERYAKNPAVATDWYYEYSRALNYVRAGRIAKDLRWTYDTEYGTLDITINLSKPEKDPRDIILAGKSKSVSYPKCQLCAENAGYVGRLDHPARQNLRPIPLNVAKGNWYFQYSPYGYYNEHTIFFNSDHTPMTVNEKLFAKLFDVLDFLPHYFVGSNAELPIVGGSILSHEHFQGGKYTFAMEKAPIEKDFSIGGHDNVKAGIVKWPMSVIRLSSPDREALASAASFVLSKWRDYNDESVSVYSHTDGVLHNTVTPIARRRGNDYECDLVLRNNLTTNERPLGLFHPAPELHHIKKENIGLIEVMGLAVLPARLAKEIIGIENAIIKGEDLASNASLAHHAPWCSEIIEKHPTLREENVAEILKAEIGEVFLKVLLDAGVFKRTPEGMAAFNRFTKTLA